MNKGQITELANHTNDAYSFNRYGFNNWKACISLMDRMGFNAREIEAVLRSKWMRWAGDASDSEYGNVTTTDLKRFLDAQPNLQKEVRELARETFTD